MVCIVELSLKSHSLSGVEIKRFFLLSNEFFLDEDDLSFKEIMLTSFELLSSGIEGSQGLRF